MGCWEHHCVALKNEAAPGDLTEFALREREVLEAVKHAVSPDEGF